MTQNVTVAGDKDSVDLTSLQPGMLYSVAVQGSTAVGAGPMSDFVVESFITSTVTATPGT